MKLLAFDTSTELLYAAVQGASVGNEGVLSHTGPGGAKASAALIPALHDLLDRAAMRLDELDAIVFGRGPGSFTGLRTACSVAQGLSFGSGVPVLGVETLMAVAEDAFMQEGVSQIVALLDARMDEVYWAQYVRESNGWRRVGEASLSHPEAVDLPAGWVLAGSGFTAYGDRLPHAAARIPAQPTATALLRLAPTLIAAGLAGPAVSATPLYIRDKVAQTTQERAALKAASQPNP